MWLFSPLSFIKAGLIVSVSPSINQLCVCTFATSPIPVCAHLQPALYLGLQVDKQATRLYSLSLTSEQIEGGLLVSAYSTAGSRFKLVLFEQRGQGQWHLVTQEDSNRTGKCVGRNTKDNSRSNVCGVCSNTLHASQGPSAHCGLVLHAL